MDVRVDRGQQAADLANVVPLSRGQRVDALTRAIERLLSEPEQAEAFGAKGRERMLASFSISAMAQGNMDVYRTVMAARSEA